MADDKKKVVRIVNGNILNIKQLKIENMCNNAIICMVAKRASGKSWVCRDIIRKLSKDIPGGVIISPTDNLNPFYKKCFPNSFIHHHFTASIMQNILNRQKEMIKKTIKKYKDNGTKVNPRLLLVMDDCLSSKKEWVNEKSIKELFFNGRHYQITYILTIQDPMGLPPELRRNFDYIFLFSETYLEEQKKIFKYYAGCFPNFNMFKQTFSYLTSNHGCMVICTRNVTGNPLDSVFWYKAENVEDLSFGDKQFNNYHANNYNPNWEERDEKNDDVVVDIQLLNKDAKLEIVKEVA